jgi:hypothetical protein
MMPMLISGRVVTDRLDWAVRMMATIRSLPLDDREAFLADSRNISWLLTVAGCKPTLRR